MANLNKKLVLVILDGFGLSSEEKGNAIFQAQTPVFNYLASNFPSTALYAAGIEVGLEFGEMGNSEVGHLNLGTGQITLQDLPRIDKSIQDGSFFNNSALKEIKPHLEKGGNLHIIGLVSDGAIHAHINHLLALLDFAKNENINKVYLHFIADGRDTSPKSALNYLKKVEEKINNIGVGKIATVLGRVYGMDRDKDWPKTQKAYQAIVENKGSTAGNPKEAIEAAYRRGETDEFITPTIITNTSRISEGDAIIFFNYRPDRAKQLSQALIDTKFNNFTQLKNLKNYYFVSFTNFGLDLPNVKVAFFAEKISGQLASEISKAGKTQFHIAESEKYPHVTYFFNGGVEVPFKGEDRKIIPSPDVATYDQKPEMSAEKITQEFLDYFQQKSPDFSVINFANPDMVGHTGNLKATIKAIEIVDSYLGKIAEKVIPNASMIVTADHGNAELMIDSETGDVCKEHTTNPVPITIIEKKEDFRLKSVPGQLKLEIISKKPVAVLADVTATCVKLTEIDSNQQMAGMNLLGKI